MADDQETGVEGWAILELMGHRRLGGWVSEATVAGAAFVRIDLPDPEDPEQVAATQFYSPSAVYAITPTTAEIARAIAAHAPRPVSRWDLRALASPAASDRDPDDHDDDFDDRPF